MVYSLLIVGGPRRAVGRRRICKACANCEHAHPFIKSSQVPTLFQSIPATDFGEVIFCACWSARFEQPMMKQCAHLYCTVGENKFWLAWTFATIYSQF